METKKPMNVKKKRKRLTEREEETQAQLGSRRAEAIKSNAGKGESDSRARRIDAEEILPSVLNNFGKEKKKSGRRTDGQIEGGDYVDSSQGKAVMGKKSQSFTEPAPEKSSRKEKKEKKRKRVTKAVSDLESLGTETEEAVESSRNDKKRKRNIEASKRPAGVIAVGEPPTRNSKEHKKCKLGPEDAGLKAGVGAKDRPSTENAKDKKSKKEKKTPKKKTESLAETEKLASSPQDRQPATSRDGANWHVDGLRGGFSRQAKFLRLLGGNKAGAAVVDPGSRPSANRSHFDAKQVCSELEKQFEAGRHIKIDFGRQRKGLGA